MCSEVPFFGKSIQRSETPDGNPTSLFLKSKKDLLSLFFFLYEGLHFVQFDKSSVFAQSLITSLLPFDSVLWEHDTIYNEYPH